MMKLFKNICKFLWKHISKKYVYDDEGFIRHKLVARIWLYVHSDFLKRTVWNHFKDFTYYSYIRLYFYNDLLYCDVRGGRGIEFHSVQIDRLRVRFGYVDASFKLSYCRNMYSLIGSPISIDRYPMNLFALDVVTERAGFRILHCPNILTMEYAPKDCYNFEYYSHTESVRNFHNIDQEFYWDNVLGYRISRADSIEQKAIAFSKWLEHSPNKIKSLDYLHRELNDVFEELLNKKLIDAIEFGIGDLQPDFIRIANIELNSNHKL